jgi:hypothetical protein
MKRLLWVLAVGTVTLSACDGQRAYDGTGVGKFAGAVELRWLGADRFLFVPDENDPLRFTGPDGKVYQPQPIYTDGGSIPRIFWSVPGYSPWALGPAYVIHDWLFMAHHCQTQGYTTTTFEDSARVMAESIKTLMETNKVHKDVRLFWSVVTAVKTSFAENIWKSPNACDLPPKAFAYGTAGEARALLCDKLAAFQKDLDKVQRESSTGTVSAARKQELDGKAALLRRQLDSNQRLVAAIGARPSGAPAATTLLKFDVKQMLGASPP